MDTSAPHQQAVVPTGHVRLVNRIVLQPVRQMGRYPSRANGLSVEPSTQTFYAPSR